MEALAKATPPFSPPSPLPFPPLVACPPVLSALELARLAAAALNCFAIVVLHRDVRHCKSLTNLLLLAPEPFSVMSQLQSCDRLRMPDPPQFVKPNRLSGGPTQ